VRADRKNFNNGEICAVIMDTRIPKILRRALMIARFLVDYYIEQGRAVTVVC
jgi:hypothetical protein